MNYREFMALTRLRLINAIDNVVGFVACRKEELFRKHSLPCVIEKRFKGHSKWQNIHRDKAINDQERSHKIQRMVKLVEDCARRDGPNPDLNNRLAALLDQCRAMSLPKDTMERAIKRSQEIRALPILYYAKGPANTMFIIEAETTKKLSTETQLIKYMRSLGGGAAGILPCKDTDVAHLFQERHVVTIMKDSTPPVELNKKGKPKTIAEDPESEANKKPVPPLLTLENAESLAIDLDADSVEEDKDEEEKDVFKFTCTFEVQGRLASELRDKGYIVVDVQRIYLADESVRVTLSRDMMRYVQKFYELLDSDEQVTNVFDNIAQAEEGKKAAEGSF